MASWSEARSQCQQDGGDLVVANTHSELQFISSLGHPDGTWIGAMYDTSININGYHWIDTEMQDPYDFYDGWSPGEPPPTISGEQRCVAIDPRGISSNLFTEVCDDITFNFICEFKTIPETCINESQLYVYDEMGDFDNNPPLEQCGIVLDGDSGGNSVEELVLNEINKIGSDQVICPLVADNSPDDSGSNDSGDFDWYEFACCGDPIGSNRQDGHDRLELWIIIVISVALFFCVFILTYLVLLALNYTHVITLDPYFLCLKFKGSGCCGKGNK